MSVSNRRRTGWTGLAAAFLVLVGADARGGGIYVAGHLDKNDDFVAHEKIKTAFPVVRYSEIELNVANGQLAVSVSETVSVQESDGITFLALFPVPAEMTKDSITFVLARGDDNVAHRVELIKGEAAQSLIESLAKTTGSAGILVHSGRTLAVVRDLALGERSGVELSYQQPVTVKNGLVSLACPMPDGSLSGRPVDRVTVTADIRDAKPLRSVFSTSHECEVERDGLYHVKARMVADQVMDSQDFRLHYVADKGDLGLRVLTYREPGEEKGYFLMLGAPSGSAVPKPPTPKDILFVLDVSGSMRGEKMEQARSAIEYCLEHLNKGDRFNVITFGTEVESFRSGLVSRSDETVDAAKVYIDEVVPRGRTNIRDALARGLAGKASKERPRIMIFLTDGTPTVGERSPKEILKQLQELNASGTSIFVMGVGHDVNAHLLDGIAEATQGASTLVGPDEEIDEAVASLYNQLSRPFLNNMEIAFGGLKVSSVFPRKHSALFRGSDLMVAGRYSGGGTHTVRVHGTLHGKPREYSCEVAFPEEAADSYAFIAPLWATRSIGFHLQEIRLRGENDELIDNVVRLSHRYGIVTEYTSFLAEEGAKDYSFKEAREETKRRMSVANGEQSGKWAFNQAGNDRSLQQRMAVQSGAANTFVDRQGKVKKAEAVKQVSGSAFYEREGTWVSSEEQGDRKVRKVKRFSEDFFNLVRTDKNFADAQRLDGDVEMNIGRDRVVVY